jgi:hypothetical protein
MLIALYGITGNNINRLVYVADNNIYISPKAYHINTILNEIVEFHLYYNIDISSNIAMPVHTIDSATKKITLTHTCLVNLPILQAYNFTENVFAILDKIIFEKL